MEMVKGLITTKKVSLTQNKQKTTQLSAFKNLLVSNFVAFVN